MLLVILLCGFSPVGRCYSTSYLNWNGNCVMKFFIKGFHKYETSFVCFLTRKIIISVKVVVILEKVTFIFKETFFLTFGNLANGTK